MLLVYYLCLCLSLLWGKSWAASAGGDGTTRELDQTPTWAVAGVCAIIIVISIALEKLLHKVGTWLTDKHKRALFEAVEKVKAELMILGFISLLLAFGQNYIIKICIPTGMANTMLPCAAAKGVDEEKDSSGAGESEHHRRLLWYERRVLAGHGGTVTCEKGHVPLISISGLHQLHLFIFFLAVFHVVYSAITMMLGRLKIRGWKAWEEETSTHNYEFSNDNARFRLTHDTSFVKAHTSFWTKLPVFFYIGCFFRQFFRSVGKADYMTLRNGFIAVHLAPGSKFDFQKYIKRSLEDDFKIIVGVSPVLWASFVVFLLINVYGWQALFWTSLIPVIIILAVGTKLQGVLTKMALEITERHAVVQGIPLVQASDKYFWFGKPQLVLYLIHFALFSNAFQITYFFWIWYSFGLKSCFHTNFTLALVKVGLGVGVLCLCSYITLPLHALVTQMGSRMKKSIFDEQTSKALKKWHMAVKKRHGKSPTRKLGSPNVSPMHSSSAYTLRRFKTTGHSNKSSMYEEAEASDYEVDPLSPKTDTPDFTVRIDRGDEHQTEIIESEHSERRNEEDFSFAKPGPVKRP
ncbi:MLO-like protein 10 [Cucurbita pepo subsp. pepo]|uniref:MLO-like protein 10 n=1 Tax=Cucurbita pepo subsp. pepo TaxID=3664 RepID=UPI000C9D8F39|nr:MLO-like protein 10 [Cucurbita pepo subsp. pepo]